MAQINYLNQTDFDHGARQRLARHVKSVGITRPLVVSDQGLKAAGVVDEVLGHLPEDMPVAVFLDTPTNPTERATQAALQLYKSEGCDGLICVGGGSPMDLGKGVGLLATHDEPIGGYLASEGNARKIGPIAPLIAVPTTSGTGSEVSVGAVFILDDGRKETLASPHLIPKIAVCDPELTLGLPPALTAATGMDAVTHCLEAFCAPAIHPPADAIALDGLNRAIAQGWLEAAVQDGSNKDARWHMMMASYSGALAFVKGLGAVHAMSHAAGRLEDLKLHHGTLNAVLLPPVLRFNKADMGDKWDALVRAMELPAGTDLADFIQGLNERLGLPANLGAMGVPADDIPQLAIRAEADLANFANPRKLTAAEYEGLFAQEIG